MTALAAACVLGGIVLLAAEQGPMMTETIPLNAFLGFTLLFFGFVLGSRVLVLIFSPAPDDGRRPPFRVDGVTLCA